MKSSVSALRRRVAATLIAITTLQPALAVPHEYRIPLQSVKVTSPSVPKPGTGAGDVDTGDNPEEARTPSLSVVPAALHFESNANLPPASRTALISNTGPVATAVGGLDSNEHFLVSHNCPASLPVDNTCNVTVTPKSAAPGVVHYRLGIIAPGAQTQAQLDLSTYERDSENPHPRLVASENVLFLGEVDPGQQVAGAVTLTNAGAVKAVLSGITSSKAFSVTHNCPDELVAGASCTISAKFLGWAGGSHSHTLNLVGEAGDYPTNVTFYAKVHESPALRPALNVDPAALSFGPLDPGMSETKSAVLSNWGTAPAELASIVGNSDFTVDSSCPDLLQVNASCGISVTYKAGVGGSTPKHLVAIRAQDDVWETLLLSGQSKGGVQEGAPAPELVFEPDAHVFGVVAVGATAQATAKLTNNGTVAASISRVLVDAGASVYSASHTCGASLAPAQSCDVSVTFKPIEARGSAGRIKVTTAEGATALLPVSGTGTQAQLSVTSTVKFDATSNMAPTAWQRVSLSNSGNVPLTGLAVQNTDARLSIDYGTCTYELQPKKGCSMSIRYAPDALGEFAGEFTVSSANGGSSKVNWSGLTLKLTAAPSSLSFGATRVGLSAPDQTVVLRNEGIEAVSISGVGIITGSAHFGQSNDCGTSLAAGESCAIVVRYTPATPRSHAGEIGVSVQGSLVSRIALNGTGTEPQLLLSKSNIQFPPTNVGQPSAVVNFTVTNPTSEPATDVGMSISVGDTQFAQSNDCGEVIAPGASCTVSVRLTPTSQADSFGTWTVASSLGIQHVSLSGQGTVPEGGIDDDTGGTGGNGGGGTGGSEVPGNDGYTHYSINFLDTEVGTTSAIRNVKFSNKGDGPLTVEGISIAKGETDFAQSNDCGQPLAPGAFCTISIVFAPTEVGPRTGGIALESDGGKFFFDLTGKGIGAVGNWQANSSANFGTVGVMSTTSRSFTLVNTGTIAAKQIMTNLVGKDLRLVSNTCGTATSPVSLPAGGSCRATVEYAPTAPGTLEGAMLETTGTLANKPVRIALTGNALPPSLTYDSNPSSNLGTVTVGTVITQTYYLRNTGKMADTIASLEMDSTSFSHTGGTCKVGLSLAPNVNCSVVISHTPTSTGPQSGTLSATSTQGAPAALVLASEAIQSEYVISGSSTTMTAPVTDYGVLTADSASANRVFYLRDNASLATLSAQSITMASEGDFSLVSITRIKPDGTNYSGCATTATAMSVPCPTPAPGYSIAVTVKFAPVSAGVKTGILRFEHNGSGGASEITLQGTGQFNATAVWSSSRTALVAPTETFKSFGRLTTGTAASKTLLLRNMGTHGGQAVGLKLAGDTEHFQLTTVHTAEQNYEGNDSTAACLTGGVIAADKLSSTPCRAQDVAIRGIETSVMLVVRYAPKGIGSHSITLTPETNNGTGLPTPITLTGAGEFNPTAEWSSTAAKQTAMTAAQLTYGTKTPGTTVDKTFFLRNVGTNGAQATGLQLTGDVSQFKIQTIRVGRQDTESVSGGCIAGGTVSADKASATPCLAEDAAGTGFAAKAVYLTIRYAPTEIGNHSVVVSTTTNNGTVLPESITLTGAGQFNPTAVWSSTLPAQTAPTSAALAYGTKTTGTATDKIVYLRNVGTNGAQAVGLTLTGDVSQFKIQAVRVGRQDTDSVEGACFAGGVIAADRASATPCLAADAAGTGYAAKAIYLTVRYVPTEIGNHSIVVATTTNNGTVLPEPITFTGTGQFNPTATWSTATSPAAPTAAWLSYGSKTVGTLTDKTIFVYNTGTHGAQSVGIALQGDTTQYKIVQISRFRQDRTLVEDTCLAGGAIASGGSSVTPCLAADKVTSLGYAGIAVKVRYAPTMAGAHSVTLAPTTNNGTVLPEPITLTGSAP